MSQPETITIPADTLRDFLTRIFAAAGCDSENARLNAIGVLEADLRGHHIQGTDHIYSTVRELRAGHLNGRAEPKIVRETAATARVDGDGGTGHATGLFATELAMRKAYRRADAVVASRANHPAVSELGACDIMPVRSSRPCVGRIP